MVKAESAECPRCGETAYADDKGRGGFYVLGGIIALASFGALGVGGFIAFSIVFFIGVGIIMLPHLSNMMECPHCKKNFTA